MIDTPSPTARYSFVLSTPCSTRRHAHKTHKSSSFTALPSLSLVAPLLSFSPLASPSPLSKSAPSTTFTRPSSASLSISTSALRVDATPFSPSSSSFSAPLPHQARRSSSSSIPPHSLRQSSISFPLSSPSRPLHRSVPSSPSSPSSPILSSFFSSGSTPSLASLLAQSWSAPASPRAADDLPLDDEFAFDIDFFDTTPSIPSSFTATSSSAKRRLKRTKQVQLEGRVPFVVSVRR